MNTMKFLAALTLGSALAISSAEALSRADYSKVLPLPASIEIPGEGMFRFQPSSRICYPAENKDLENNARMLAEYLRELTGYEPEITSGEHRDGDIILSLDPSVTAPEGYRITVNSRNIRISSGTPAGGFYGIQTLRKSLDADGRKDGEALFPEGEILDAPRFTYRGAHLDVARHFFPLDSVKRFIDILALHNVNRFHWHLSDDQGWRIEIKKRPLLTSEGSRRKGTCIGRHLNTSDSVPYGGFYTQEEAKDLVEYARRHYIEVIPEIDMPGHMVAALTAYPEIGCKGGGYDVWHSWGVNDEVLCAGNDSTYRFVDDVLGEIMEIFPGEYIHIGGDECPKTRWEKCPKCQAKADALGLQTDSISTREQKLQTAFMAHAVEFLSRNGRKAIGWDEILEGGLPQDAAVMSWRGTSGAAEAARQGHDAVLTPDEFCYFNYYQSLDTDKEPLAIGGYVPLKKVYSFEPVAEGLTPEQARHILGAQSNIWTEYIPEFWGIEYMEMPRLAALAEVQWCDPGKKDLQRFIPSLIRLMKHYDLAGYHYGHHLYNPEISMTPTPGEKGMTVTVTTLADAPVHYTLDGSEPTSDSPLYTGPFKISSTVTVKAAAFPGGVRSRISEDSLRVHKAFMRPVSFTAAPNVYGAPEGVNLAVNGRRGTLAFASGQWLGFYKRPVEAVIDLEESAEVSKVGVGILVDAPNWIFNAREIEIEGSLDGHSYFPLASRKYPEVDADIKESRMLEFTFPTQEARYLRLKVTPEKSIPQWHGARGEEAHVFIDEIIVE